MKKKKKNPLEGKEVRMHEGIVYEPKCKTCGEEGFGFHIVDAGEKFDSNDVKDAGCPECGSEDLEWLPAGYSEGMVLMKKGWKAKNKCKSCAGTGIAFANDPTTGFHCEECNGTGEKK